MSETQTQINYIDWPKEIKKIMFVIVMEHEANDLISLINLKRDETTLNNPFLEGYTCEYNNKQVILVKPPIDPVYKVQSVSTEPASLCVYAAIKKYNPDIVISAGTSGGVKRKENPDLHLKIKDIVVAQSIQFFTRTIIIKDWEGYVAGKQYNLLNPKPLHQILALKPVIIGTDNSFTNDNTHAIEQGIDCIEMEAAAELRVCHLLNVPFTAIKIISDVEMDDPTERETLFKDFFVHGIKNLSIKLKEFLDDIDKIANW
ncbi:phosphorylase family protein (macronuclear) [Tetrahymena thermophila SB210]|uniref:Phosphorylase family protein n=1 Tax=Tetrahymena thermophila (strain SB210) TaxID=312017 RepID=Q236P2_TETTS|nr:phosphorylase family protein [Tetrahymena thermophila SB210]EAR92458.1 phosphorylase family protein [Tetrahymena thermophila SB210]|eukprot:XP_001012703.1 phosphorylase family protein [Tetrahymena thermophila SB210]